MTAVLTSLALGLLMAAVWRDVATRLIPDSLCLALLLVALALRLPSGWMATLGSLGAALLLFCALFCLAMGGLLGGGDVKLAGAFAAALPPSMVWDFLVSTILAGGLLGIGYIAAARVAPHPEAGSSLLRRVLAVEAWRIRRRAPLPYAVAIAAGGALVLLGQQGM
ncbi:prepilin peptidase [Pararoseomonas indoligenes]|uniref:Prepilin peptidase n=1 Tax=Roseomonas indoligenes TaxID=2820811 RepID=A0A940MUW5_9PROT|nr:prepilin peptidase [Pararoseomonas indoligenes]MBP0493879.1 prepilin peptidase [Pararoseomonas indoligenes]